MQDCIFCQIVAGKSPSYKVYEDDLFFAFLDIFPKTKGHVLLVPKKHYPWVQDVPEFGRYWETALKITRALEKALKPHFIQYYTYGLEVPHAHIHIIPQPKALSPVEAIAQKSNFSKEEFEETAEKIRNAL